MIVSFRIVFFILRLYGREADLYFCAGAFCALIRESVFFSVQNLEAAMRVINCNI